MNPTDSEQPQYSRLHDLLTRAAALPAAERDVFLTRECGDDHALRQQIHDHLMAEAKGLAKKKLEAKTGPVTNAVRQALAGSAHDRRVELLGKVVGDYRLTAILGAGGAGTVYLGERADRAYSAQVAIKVVANTQLNQEVQRRFSAERQILANLNHPYIGRLMDAGETFFDEPFLVMEYVHGEAIDRYCNNQRLSIGERIELFLKVCDAVQYAHRNLIVHRDLKPGNILVSKEGIPKLLDFGIAKLLDESAQAILQDGMVAHTRVHDRLLTPEYASPEQIRGQPVTTASDVYSLGVVLYELLTGVRPYAVNAQNQLELEKSICIQDPLRPSQMTAALDKDASTTTPLVQDASLIPIARKTSFKKLAHDLQGDLDAIVMKALRKEPEHRYSSVEHLIDDLHHYLHQEPVDARQGNRWYYTQRFVRRHTLGVVASTAALMGLIAVAIILSVQANRLKEQRDIANQQTKIANRERDKANHERDRATQESARAESVSNFLQDIFTAADPYQSQDKQVTAKELLDRAAERISNDLSQQPEVRARLLEAIGKSYVNQEQGTISIRYLEEALRLQRQLSTSEPIRVASILNYLGRAYFSIGSFDKADNALTEARNLLISTKHDLSADFLQLLTDSGGLEQRLSHPTKARQYFEKGLNLSRSLHGNYRPETATMLMQLAQVHIWQSNYVESEKLLREAVNIYHSTLPEKQPDRINADLNLADLLIMRGQLSEALSLITKGLADQRSVYGNDSPRLIGTYSSLSKVQLALRRLEDAENSARIELSIAEKNFGKLNFDTGVTHSTVASVLSRRMKFVEAENEARISLKILQATASPDHQYVASAEYLLASALNGQRRFKEAEPLLRENMARWTRAEAPAWRAARSESALGVALLQLKKPQDAKQALNNAYKVLSTRESGADPDTIAMAKKRLDQFHRCASDHHELDCQLTI